MSKNLFNIIILLILAASCAIQQPVVKEQHRITAKMPPGVDTLTVILADSIFSQVMVDDEDANNAREIFNEAQVIDGLADSLWDVRNTGLQNYQDSLMVLDQLERADKYLQLDPEKYKQLRKSMKKEGKLNYNVISSVSKQLMLHAIGYFENAIKNNRFNINYRQGFSKYLKKLADRFKDNKYLVRAADELERVVFVIKNLHPLFYELGEIYYQLNKWDNAFKNYELAENTLRKTAIFSVENPDSYFTRISEVPVDTNRLVSYISQQAGCKTKLYQAQPALALYREAKEITPDSGLKDYFGKRIEWILWDDGNIRASEKNDRATVLAVDKKDYVTAKSVYLELLPILWTKRTKDETNWKIAQIDYRNLNNKAEGVARMHYVIKNSALDSLSGAPLDSTYKRYFDTYGRMCFNLGNELIKVDRLYAYIYFQQAASTRYVEQGKAFLQLAQNSLFDPGEAIDLCNKTMDYLNELDEKEEQLLYQTFYLAYRKLGDFQKAKLWFEKYNSF